MPTTLRSPRAARLAAACAATLLAMAPLTARSAPAASPTSPQSGQPAGAAATAPASAVPVREVVLFSSGVGYFEHFGTVNGDASAELSFKKEQINDILKSLLLEDMDHGTVTAVTYGSQAPLAQTLKSFGVDIAANPSLAELLNQLRGASVTVWTHEAQLAGTILGVEHRPGRVVPPPLSPQQIPQPAGDTWVLNLLGEGGSIHPVELEKVSEVKLTDPKLQHELTQALLALSLARDQDKKPVTVHFKGQGQRRVRIGYVVETPVWKSSYRLVLPPPQGAGGAKPEGGGDTVPAATRPAGGGGAAAGPAGAAEGHLQGWAIVENQTDNDWQDVQLSLVSGRPISFIQDLYQPLYVPRPVVQPQLFASLRPQTYEGGFDLRNKEMDKFAADGAGDEKAKDMAYARLRGAAAPMPAPGLAAPQSMLKLDEQKRAALDPTASIASIASAAKVGELFEYTVGNVSLPRQQSAMIPIVTDAVMVHRLSIYNASVLPRNPLLGARLTNSTGKDLPQGPLTVLDGGSYAGDATIQDLPPTQSRLISYGVDQQVLVNATSNSQNNQLLTGRIVKGVLELTYKQMMSQDYVAENKGDHDKSLLIEHPLHPGWKLVEPAKAEETTDTLYRFEGNVGKGKTSKLTVREELVQAQQFQILSLDIGQVEVYARTGEIPAHVRDALLAAAQLKGHLVDTQRQIQERQQKINEIGVEQARLRENMKTVAPSSDYYQRLLKKLDEQETAIEKLQAEVRELQQKQQTQQKDLEQYLQNLDVSSDVPKK